MSKKTWVGILLAMLICLSIGAAAVDDEYVTVGDVTYYTYWYMKYAYVTGCDANATSVTLETEVDGYPVRGIGSNAFEDCGNLKSVTIPDDVFFISSNAFLHCYSLESLTIPDGMTSISESSFSNCGLKSITVNVGSKAAKALYDAGWRKCESPSAPGWLWYESEGQLYITGYIGSETSVSIPLSIDGVPVTGIDHFSCGDDLKNVTIPDSVTDIGLCAFYGCSNLTGVTIPDSVTDIGSCAFYGCSNLTGVTIPDSVTDIGSYAFYGCGLTKIKIGKGVKSIGDGAFVTCNLRGIYIPDNVTKFGNSVIDSDQVVNCEQGSAAEKWAKKNGYMVDYGKSLWFDKLKKSIWDECVRSGMSDYEKALALHDWLVRNVEYDYTYTRYNGIEILFYGTGVCQAYSEAYGTLLDLAGIPNRMVIGDNHAWTQIQLGGEWYHVDVTWDDDLSTHMYFGLSDDAIGLEPKNHYRFNIHGAAGYKYNYDYVQGSLNGMIDRITELVRYKLASMQGTSATYTIPLFGIYSTDLSDKFRICTSALAASDKSYSNEYWKKIKAEITYNGWEHSLTVKAKAEDGGKLIKSMTFPKNINDKKIVLKKGKSYQLKITLKPSKNLLNSKLKFQLENENDKKYVKVSKDGTIKAVRNGKAVLKISAQDGSKLSLKLTVIVGTPVEKVKLSKSKVTLAVGKTKTLTKTVSPSSASVKSVKWSSSDPKVATVSGGGKITAKKKGTCTITCTATDGSGEKATCKVTVK